MRFERTSRMSKARMVMGIPLFLLLVGAGATTRPTPPPQPGDGPGGGKYPFGGLSMHRFGQGDGQYWIFEPADPIPKSAPVIIFNHGWSAMTPNSYGAWIRHLVRRGSIVIFPRYQASVSTPMKEFTPNAVAAIKAAMVELQTGEHVKPELDRVAIVGHSMGGAITPNLAALAAEEGLPIPKAICCVEPGNHLIGNAAIHMPVEDFSKIAADTLALVIVGDRDLLAGDDTAKMIFAGLTQIPPEKKDYITLVSDDYGYPPLIANHMAPVSLETLDPDAVGEPSEGPVGQRIRRFIEQKPVNALAYYGVWKLFDGLTDAAFFGKNGQYALGNTPQQRYMGKWSDGTAVKELKVTTQP